MTIATRPTPGPAREYHFPAFTRSVLANGITVIVARVTKLPLVSVATVIDATALDDFREKEGLAELTAQSLREGTEERNGVRLALDLEKLGTSLEAGADWDGTVLGRNGRAERGAARARPGKTGYFSRGWGRLGRHRPKHDSAEGESRSGIRNIRGNTHVAGISSRGHRTAEGGATRGADAAARRAARSCG